MNETIALPHLAEQLAAKAGIDIEDAENFIRRFFEQVENALAVDEEVNIKGLGRFFIDSKLGVRFEPDKDFAEYLNQPFDMFSPIEIEDETDLIEDNTEVAEIEEPAVLEEEETEIAIGPDSVPQKEVETESETLVEDEAATADEAPIEQKPEASEPIVMPSYAEEYEEQPRQGERKHIFGYVITAIVCLSLGYLLHNFVDSRSETEVIVTEEIVTLTDSIAPSDSIYLTEPVVSEDSITAPVETIKMAVTDTVTPTRFLTTMARQYYGQMEYWVFIYLANEDKLGNPNRTRPGTVVVIPDKADFTADETPQQTLARAKRLGRDIYKRYE